MLGLPDMRLQSGLLAELTTVGVELEVSLADQHYVWVVDVEDELDALN